MTELLTCGRCGATDREVRPWWANLEREHREDRVPHQPPHFAIEDRCRDRQACRVRRQAMGRDVDRGGVA